MKTAARDYDLIVIGGGPAGVTLATLVSTAGHRVLLLEQCRDDQGEERHAIWPATLSGICPLLGVSNTIRTSGFPKQTGVVVQWAPGYPLRTYRFSPASDVEREGYGYQVVRTQFNRILLENARHKGVEVQVGCKAIALTRERGRVSGVMIRVGKQAEAISAAYLADASGASSIFYQDVTTRIDESGQQATSIQALYSVDDRAFSRDSGADFYFASATGWLHYTAVADGVARLGAIVSRQVSDQSADKGQLLDENVEASADLKLLLGTARRLFKGLHSDVRVAPANAYSNAALWDAGIVLVGDAACAVRPPLSSGVHLGMYGALQAARSINSILQGDMDEVRALTQFETRYRAEYVRQLRQFAVAERLRGQPSSDTTGLAWAHYGPTAEPVFRSDEEYLQKTATEPNAFRGVTCCDLDEAVLEPQLSSQLAAPIQSVRTQILRLSAKSSTVVPTADGLRWSDSCS